MEGEMDTVVGSSSKPCGPLTDYRIPDYILRPDAQRVLLDHAPPCPVLVFINSGSGGQLGSSLIKTYRELLNEAQVFDVSEEAPDKVLHRLNVNLERLKIEGDILAVQIWRTLRLIVAGGDGTASWLLGVVSDLKLSHPPPIATVPLGTGNNLPFSFGWGKKNPCTDQESVKSFLGLVRHAKEMKIDSWHIMLRMRATKEGPCDPIAPLELPHSLHAFHRVSSSDSLNMEGYHTFRGGFWNYFSMGMDAEISYGFHSERKKNPEKFKNQLTNQRLETYNWTLFRCSVCSTPISYVLLWDLTTQHFNELMRTEEVSNGTNTHCMLLEFLTVVVTKYCTYICSSVKLIPKYVTP